MSQQYMDETPSKHKIIISNGVDTVQMPLPDGFGFSVGSEFDTPFDTGSITSMLQKVSVLSKFEGVASKGLAGAGISQKMALTMRKGFINPQPSEISFEGEFTAFYSATDEVLVPIRVLLKMALASKVTGASLENAVREVSRVIANSDEAVKNAVSENKTSEKIQGYVEKGVVGRATDQLTSITTGVPDRLNLATDTVGDSFIGRQGSRLLDIISISKGPSPVIIQFGDVFTLENAFVSSIGIKFSNKVDSVGVPLSANVSITCVLETPPTADTMVGPNGAFSRIRG